MNQLILALALMAAAAETCGIDQLTGPGQANYRATITVLNRTVGEVTLTGGGQTLTVPPCGESTAGEFPINFWQLASPGRDGFRSTGGSDVEHSFLVVTNVVRQSDARPDPLPPCDGLFQAP